MGIVHTPHVWPLCECPVTNKKQWSGNEVDWIYNRKKQLLKRKVENKGKLEVRHAIKWTKPPFVVLGPTLIFLKPNKSQPRIQRRKKGIRKIYRLTLKPISVFLNKKRITEQTVGFKTNFTCSYLHPLSDSCPQKSVSSLFQSPCDSDRFPLTSDCVLQQSVKRL